MRYALALLVLWLAASPALARPDDVTDWRGARWGMTAPELDRSVPGIRPLPAPFRFAGAQATRRVETELGGVPMLGLFQLGNGAGRLQQVLLETRRKATPAAHRQVAEALRAAYGPADATCVQTKDFGDPMVIEQVWRFPTTVVHATMLDMTTTRVFDSDPNAPPSQLAPQRNNWRGFPRRILVRYHPADRLDLWGNCGRP